MEIQLVAIGGDPDVSHSGYGCRCRCCPARPRRRGDDGAAVVSGRRRPGSYRSLCMSPSGYWEFQVAISSDLKAKSVSLRCLAVGDRGRLGAEKGTLLQLQLMSGAEDTRQLQKKNDGAVEPERTGACACFAMPYGVRGISANGGFLLMDVVLGCPVSKAFEL